MKTRQFKIGIFDSGFGGLSILRAIVHKLPQYDYLYLGDTARAPYGSRSQEVIYQFTEQAVDFLLSQGCWLITLACNTASAEALRKIQQEYLPIKYPGRRVLGVLIPAVEDAIKKTKNNRIGVVGTLATVGSKAFAKEIYKLNPQVQVFQQACPLLAPIVEEGEQDSEIAILALRKYLAPLLREGIDTLILGCTHYGFLEKQIQQIVGSEMAIISESQIVADKLADYLSRHPEIEGSLSQGATQRFLTTDITDKFQRLGPAFFGSPLCVEKVVFVDNIICIDLT